MGLMAKLLEPSNVNRLILFYTLFINYLSANFELRKLGTSSNYLK